ncbi:MAG: HAD-IA family hydrolase [Solirubrobacteraceae bacterium]
MHAPRRRTPDAPALLIDGMGTLVALASPVAELRRRLDAEVGVTVSLDEARHALGAEIAYYRAHMQCGRDAESLAALRGRCAAALRDALPERIVPERLDLDAVTGALLGALRFVAYPDARPALLDARRRGVRVVVVSNWDVSLIEVLELVGLSPLLDAVITSAAVGARKPDPEIFRHALAVAGVGAEAAVHVGDSLQEDVAGARACGIAAVLVSRDGAAAPGPEGVATIAGLTELDALWPYISSGAHDRAH